MHLSQICILTTHAGLGNNEFFFQDYDAQDLLDFEETILRGVDYDQDGKINRKELTMILLAIAKHNEEAAA